MVSEANYKNAADLIYLLSAAVNSAVPDADRVSLMDIQALYTLAQAHSVAAAASCALSSAGVDDDSFREAKAKSVRNSVLFEAERAKIYALLDSFGIWYLPLKGAVLKDDYPVFGMREMGDTDVLCDADRMADVKTVMESLGYSCEYYQTGSHDVYHKPPVLRFEMHRTLFDEKDLPVLVDYYSDIENKLLPVGSGSMRRFTPEDFYIYMLAHEYKHYRHAGTGLRSLLDVYVFLKSHQSEMNADYLEAELKKAQLYDFEKLNRRLAFSTFESGLPDESLMNELEDFIYTSVYGNSATKARRELYYELGYSDSKASKRRLILRRVFISGDELREKYPFFHRHKLLLPSLYAYRLAKAPFNSRRLSEELRTIREFKADPKDSPDVISQDD